MQAIANPAAIVTDIGQPQTRTRVFAAGIAVSSFAALLLELALTRLFSVVLFYHFAFLAISIALLGLGSGGVFAYVGKKRLAHIESRRLLTALSLANTLAIPLTLEVVLHVPVSLELSGENFLRLSAMYLGSAVPFFITGLAFSLIFARQSEHIAHLYGADLVGGALACLAIVPLLNFLGGPNTLLFSALMSAIAALIWAPTTVSRKIALGLILALLGVIAGNHSGRLVDVVYAKGQLRDPSWVEFARWNAISRIEVDRQGGAKVIVIDADASTYIMSADLNHWQGSEWERDLMSAPPALVNVLQPHGTYAIIGPGGGVDVLRAVGNGSPSVTGIEINRIIADTIMRGTYAGFSNHLYDRPDVHIHISDGRSFIRNSSQKFDVVQMTLVDTWASTAAGAFALSENSLYTVEAFRAYFEHLNPDGMIAITRWEFRQPREALRVVSVAMQALHQLGIANPAKNFAIVCQGQLNEDGIPVAVLAKKRPFTREEEQAVQSHLKSNPGLSSLYLPSQPESNAFSSLIASNDPYSFAQHYPYNVAPVTDDAPFFFFTLKLKQILAGTDFTHAIDWKVNLGVAVLGMVLAISLLALAAFLIIPLAWRGTRRSQRATPLLYFVAVGLGYILVEIAFIQRFVLFLGHPTYALTVVVFLLLLSSGVGSLASRKWLAEPRRVWFPLIFIAGGVLLYVLVLPRLLNTLIGLPFAAKVLVSGGLLIPLGIAMGVPFPSGLRSLAGVPAAFSESEAAESAIEWAWALNAGASVLGSVLAMVIAMQFGLTITLACGGAAYLLALLFSKTFPPRLA
ncbi:MAG: hypothetical protein JOZ80_19890 [Acidobacteriaceae bacterium]|nr:hypothetical protein [Acidobacteriaceae bacterium]